MFKRRREKKTDYKQRLKLLKSGKPRLVVRKSLNHMRSQIIKFDEKGDKTLVSATSEELKKYNWKKHTGNSESAYLTGLLLAKKAKRKGIKDCVIDIGLQKFGKNILSFLKGAKKGGLNFPINKNFPKLEIDKNIEEKITKEG